MLTETRFKELYGEAERLRASGAKGAAAAGEILLYLFDNGRSVGGFGVVHLSFVLRDLAALADLANPRPGQDALRLRRALEKRRDEHERQAALGEAGFTDVQELVALNRALGTAERSAELARRIAPQARASDDVAAVCRILDQLTGEAELPADAEKIALQYERERLLRRLVELERTLAPELAAPVPSAAEVDRLAAEIQAQCDRFRRADHGDLPRGEREKRELAELAEATAELLREHARYARSAPAEGTMIHLAHLARQLAALFKRFDIRGDLLRDAAIRDQLVRLARATATQIAELRISQDLPREGDLPAEAREERGVQVLRDGLIVYEALLRIDEGTLAERTGAWLLAFRHSGEMYSSLAAAAARARKPAVERRLREQAQRLSRG